MVLNEVINRRQLTTNPAFPDYPLVYLPLNNAHFSDGSQTRLTNRYGPHAVFIRSSKRSLLSGSEVTTGTPGWESDGLWIEEGTTNLLTQNQASVETDTTGFSVSLSGGTVTKSRDTTERWHGSASLKIVTDGAAANQGAYTDPPTNVTASQNYTASVYVKGTGTVRLGLEEKDVNGAIIGASYSSAISLTGSWQRLTVTRAFGATGVKATLTVYTTVAQAATFYLDGLQLEQKAYATSWQDPAVARTDEFLSGDGRAWGLVPLPPQGTIIVGFVRQNTLPTNNYEKLWDLGSWTPDISRDRFTLSHPGATSYQTVKLEARVQSRGIAAAVSATIPGGTVIGKRYFACVIWSLPGWARVIVMRPDIGAIYESGVESWTFSPLTFAHADKSFRLGTERFGGRVNAVVALSRALTRAEAISAMEALAASRSPW